MYTIQCVSCKEVIIKIIYIAGKYRGNTKEEVDSNITLAKEYAIKIWKMGHACFCPHTNSAYFGEHDIKDDLFPSLQPYFYLG